MDPGNWNSDKTFLSGFTNPIYLPQLTFRTFLATTIGAVVALALTSVFTKTGTEIRTKAIKFLSTWILVFAPLSMLGGYWYYNVIPSGMVNNLSVAVGTQQFQNYYDQLQFLLFGITAVVMALAISLKVKPNLPIPKLAYVVPVLLVFTLLGYFERVREFIRKPYVIGGYMYSNTYRVEEYDLLNKDGILKHAAYVSTPEITTTNQIEAGENVFMLACSRCHTMSGINSLVDKFDNLYGNKPDEWSNVAMKAYIKNMHNSRYYMPPFPGNEQEIDVLVAYIKSQQYQKVPALGVQITGLKPKNIESGVVLNQKLNQ
jgi:cytochrome c553